MLVCNWCGEATTTVNTGEDLLDYCEGCHMLEDTKEVYMRVFISAERFELDTATNHIRTTRLQELLAQMGYDYEVVLGSYKGSKEVALMVYAEPDLVTDILTAAKEFQQESIMTVDHLDRATFIKVSNGLANSGGVLNKIDSNNLPDSWVKIGEEYFTAE